MATLPKVLIDCADYQIGGGVALRLRTQEVTNHIDSRRTVRVQSSPGRSRCRVVSAAVFPASQTASVTRDFALMENGHRPCTPVNNHVTLLVAALGSGVDVLGLEASSRAITKAEAIEEKDPGRRCSAQTAGIPSHCPLICRAFARQSRESIRATCAGEQGNQDLPRR
jgi:hypothetical protein